jgi:hypothetical protein
VCLACSFVGCGCRMLSFLAPLSVLSLRVADGIVAVVAARVAAATVDAVVHGVWGCVGHGFPIVMNSHWPLQ